MGDFSIIDTFWVFLAAILVFFMNLGFAAVEAGFARSKNTVNILSKNFIQKKLNIGIMKKIKNLLTK